MRLLIILSAFLLAVMFWQNVQILKQLEEVKTRITHLEQVHKEQLTLTKQLLGLRQASNLRKE